MSFDCIPERTRVSMEAMHQMTDPMEFLQAAVAMLGNSYMHECDRPVRYSPTTGKPVEYERVSESPWDGEIWFVKCSHLVSVGTESVRRFLASISETAPLVIHAAAGTYVVTPFMQSDRDHWGLGEIRQGVRVSRAQVINWTA